MSLDGERPSAEAVARAVCAAARVLDEDPLSLFDAPRGELKTRFAALEALKILYPGSGHDVLGRMVGVAAKPVAAMVNAKRADWWPGKGAAAVEAALGVLEVI